MATATIKYSNKTNLREEEFAVAHNSMVQSVTVECHNNRGLRRQLGTLLLSQEAEYGLCKHSASFLMILDSIDNMNHHSTQWNFNKEYLFQKRMKFFLKIVKFNKLKLY